jgi:hypothetical protein
MQIKRREGRTCWFHNHLPVQPPQQKIKHLKIVGVTICHEIHKHAFSLTLHAGENYSVISFN